MQSFTLNIYLCLRCSLDRDDVYHEIFQMASDKKGCILGLFRYLFAVSKLHLLVLGRLAQQSKDRKGANETKLT